MFSNLGAHLLTQSSRLSNGDVSSPSWLNADLRTVWHPYTQMKTAPPPIPVERGEGVYLITPDGRRILDGISSWWVNLHGHGHPRLNAALARQAEKVAQVIFAGFTHEPAATLAQELISRTPAELTRVFYSDDGSTAVEVALKMAYQGWRNRGEKKRTLFVAFDGAYHGDTFGTMATGAVEVFHQEFQGLFFEVRHAHGPYCGTHPGASGHGKCPPSLEEILDAEGERVAAVIVEPMVQGAGGMIIQPPEFLRRIRELTHHHGIPLIADEVFTGFGRTGRFFACEHGPVAPDLLCLSKGLTAGYLPLSATLATDEIYQAFLSEDRGRTFFHGHSFTANALSCAVALESLAIFDSEQVMDRIARLEALFQERLPGLAKLPCVEGARTLGGLAALDIGGGDGGYLDGRGPWLAEQFLARDILLRPLGNVLYFLPPYAVTDQEAHHVFETMEEVLSQLS